MYKCIIFFYWCIHSRRGDFFCLLVSFIVSLSDGPISAGAQERREMWLITVVVLAALHKDSCNPLLYCWKMSIFSTPTRVMMKNKRLVSLAKTFPVFPSIVSDKFVSRKRSLLARDGYFVKRICNFKEHTTVSQIANRSITFASWELISFSFFNDPLLFLNKMRVTWTDVKSTYASLNNSIPIILNKWRIEVRKS